MNDAITLFAEQFGLLPLYAVIISVLGFTAGGFKHLIFVLGILCGVYVTMFKAFNLKAQFGPFDPTQFIPVSQEIGNIIVAVVFVYAIGFLAYGVKRMVVPSVA